MDNNLGYLLAAFGVIWVGLFAYVLVLLRREKRLRRDVATLKESLGKERA